LVAAIGKLALTRTLSRINTINGQFGKTIFDKRQNFKHKHIDLAISIKIQKATLNTNI